MTKPSERKTPRRPAIERDDDGRIRIVHLDRGVSVADFPSALSRAPLHWECLGQNFSMELLAGLMGSSQDPDTLAIRPEIGWAVRDVTDAGTSGD